MVQDNSQIYNIIVEYIRNLSSRINKIYKINPKIFLHINQENKIGGEAIIVRDISNMYIILYLPHNYTFGRVHKITIACMLIHEYCHYIEAFMASRKKRIHSIDMYNNDSKCLRADEYRNWTATKRLAKKLRLWNKAFYTIACKFKYTAALQY